MEVIDEKPSRIPIVWFLLRVYLPNLPRNLLNESINAQIITIEDSGRGFPKLPSKHPKTVLVFLHCHRILMPNQLHNVECKPRNDQKVK